MLNPAEKSKRYARQLKKNCIAETGEVLTSEQRAWRKGYLNSRQESSDVYKWKSAKTEKERDKLRAERKQRRDYIKSRYRRQGS